MITNVIGNKTSDKVEEQLIAELRDSRTVNIAYHANDPGVGLSLNKNMSRFKMFVCDTGLFVTLAFKDKSFTENIIYQKLLNDKLDANLGYIYENAVAQILKAKGDNLFYYTFPTESGHNYEIDFILSRNSKICPIEVKSSSYRRHISLDKFCKKYSKRISEKYVVYTKDFRKEADVNYLPIYMTQFL